MSLKATIKSIIGKESTMSLITQGSTTGNVEGKEILTVENEYWKLMWESLERLQKNDDFKRVILDGYFKDKAINGVSLLAIDGIKRQGLRGEIMEELVAISSLQDFFITIENLGTVPTIDEEEDGE